MFNVDPSLLFPQRSRKDLSLRLCTLSKFLCALKKGSVDSGLGEFLDQSLVLIFLEFRVLFLLLLADWAMEKDV
jgi:hypothetical protein